MRGEGGLPSYHAKVSSRELLEHMVGRHNLCNGPFVEPQDAIWLKALSLLQQTTPCFIKDLWKIHTTMFKLFRGYLEIYVYSSKLEDGLFETSYKTCWGRITNSISHTYKTLFFLVRTIKYEENGIICGNFISPLHWHLLIAKEICSYSNNRQQGTY